MTGTFSGRNGDSSCRSDQIFASKTLVLPVRKRRWWEKLNEKSLLH